MMTDALESEICPLNVVVAEDEPLLRMLVVEVMDDRGFIVREAEHAAAALAICKAQADEIDVLFTDVRMPGSMDGVELAHRVRENWPWISVVITSGNISASHKELPEGARFVPKPYDMHHVVELMRELRRDRGAIYRPAVKTKYSLMP
jgi:CheY-like chemotaxis protein